MKEFYLEVDEIAKYHANILYEVLIVDNFKSKKLQVFRQAVKLMKLEIWIQISLPKESESTRKLCKKSEAYFLPKSSQTT